MEESTQSQASTSSSKGSLKDQIQIKLAELADLVPPSARNQKTTLDDTNPTRQGPLNSALSLESYFTP